MLVIWNGAGLTPPVMVTSSMYQPSKLLLKLSTVSKLNSTRTVFPMWTEMSLDHVVKLAESGKVPSVIQVEPALVEINTVATSKPENCSVWRKYLNESVTGPAAPTNEIGGETRLPALQAPVS